MYQFLIPAVAVVVSFIVGVLLSQKVKDAIAGVPAHVRADLNTVEATLLGRIKSAQSNVLADLQAKVAPPVPVLQTAGPAPAQPVTMAVTVKPVA